MKIGMLVHIDEILDGFEFHEISIIGSWVIALDLVEIRHFGLVDMIQTTNYSCLW